MLPLFLWTKTFKNSHKDSGAILIEVFFVTLLACLVYCGFLEMCRIGLAKALIQLVSYELVSEISASILTLQENNDFFCKTVQKGPCVLCPHIFSEKCFLNPKNQSEITSKILKYFSHITVLNVFEYQGDVWHDQDSDALSFFKTNAKGPFTGVFCTLHFAMPLVVDTFTTHVMQLFYKFDATQPSSVGFCQHAPAIRFPPQHIAVEKHRNCYGQFSNKKPFFYIKLKAYAHSAWQASSQIYTYGISESQPIGDMDSVPDDTPSPFDHLGFVMGSENYKHQNNSRLRCEKNVKR